MSKFDSTMEKLLAMQQIWEQQKQNGLVLPDGKKLRYCEVHEWVNTLSPEHLNMHLQEIHLRISKLSAAQRKAVLARTIIQIKHEKANEHLVSNPARISSAVLVSDHGVLPPRQIESKAGLCDVLVLRDKALPDHHGTDGQAGGPGLGQPD